MVPSTILNNFTAYIGEQKRWIEVRPLYTSLRGESPELTGEYVIYSNARRNSIGELQQEVNQDSSILGSFFFSFETSVAEFKGKETLRNDELRDLSYLIKSTVTYHYARCLGLQISPP